MPVTDCIKDSPKWISGFSVLSLIYLIVAIYSVVSLKRYWRVFKDQTFLSILSRISFSITLFLKFFGIFASLLIGLYAHTRNNSYVFSLCGLFLLEFPCYMVALSFTIVLLNWLSMCLQILPAKYERFYKYTKFACILYNIAFIALFLVSVVIEVWPDSFGTKTEQLFSGIVAILRDFVLCSLLFWFVFILKKGLNEDQFKVESPDEKKIYWATLALSFLVFIRGLASLAQGAFFIPNEQECFIPFYSIFLITELLNQALPLFFLLYVNNSFLFEQNNATATHELLE